LISTKDPVQVVVRKGIPEGREESSWRVQPRFQSWGSNSLV